MLRAKSFALISLLLAMALVVGACAAPTQAPPATDAPAAPQATSAPQATAASQEPAAPEPGEEMPEVTGALPLVNPLEVSGDIISAGSSTVFPLAERMADRFQDEGYSGQITIDSIGSGAGYQRFCETGETDISNASRAIRPSEIESCRAIGREPVEFRVGTDAIAVVVNPANEFLAGGVTMEQLALIFSNEAQTWADVDPSWPAEAIQRFSPGTDSGTFDYFVEAVMDPAYTTDAAPEGGPEALLSASNLQLSEDDNVLVQGVEGDVNGIGYFGYAYYVENADRLQILSLNGVTASNATVDNNTYPLARPLFIYSDPTIMQSKPQVAAFINFFLTYVNEEVIDVGYFPASETALNSAKVAFLDAAYGELAAR